MQVPCRGCLGAALCLGHGQVGMGLDLLFLFVSI